MKGIEAVGDFKRLDGVLIEVLQSFNNTLVRRQF